MIMNVEMEYQITEILTIIALSKTMEELDEALEYKLRKLIRSERNRVTEIITEVILGLQRVIHRTNLKKVVDYMEYHHEMIKKIENNPNSSEKIDNKMSFHSLVYVLSGPIMDAIVFNDLK